MCACITDCKSTPGCEKLQSPGIYDMYGIKSTSASMKSVLKITQYMSGKVQCPIKLNREFPGGGDTLSKQTQCDAFTVCSVMQCLPSLKKNCAVVKYKGFFYC